MSKKILLAVDGSEASMKAVQYVAELAASCGDFDIELFHVHLDLPAASDSGEFEFPYGFDHLWDLIHVERDRWRESTQKKVKKEIFDPARALFNKTGAGQNGTKIRSKVVFACRSSIAPAIIRESYNGKHGTVVLGRLISVLNAVAVVR